MGDAGFYRGTSSEQDSRFTDKERKLLGQMKFEEVLKEKVNMQKVNLDVIKPWITKRINEILGLEDDVVVEFVFSQLEIKDLDPRIMQINLTGFLNAKKAREFMGELWQMLTDAEKTDDGIPPKLVEMKMEMMKRKQEGTESSRRMIDRSLDRNSYGPRMPPNYEDRDRDRSYGRREDHGGRGDRNRPLPPIVPRSSSPPRRDQRAYDLEQQKIRDQRVEQRRREADRAQAQSTVKQEDKRDRERRRSRSPPRRRRFVEDPSASGAPASSSNREPIRQRRKFTEEAPTSSSTSSKPTTTTTSDRNNDKRRSRSRSSTPESPRRDVKRTKNDRDETDSNEDSTPPRKPSPEPEQDSGKQHYRKRRSSSTSEDEEVTTKKSKSSKKKKDKKHKKKHKKSSKRSKRNKSDSSDDEKTHAALEPEQDLEEKLRERALKTLAEKRSRHDSSSSDN